MNLKDKFKTTKNPVFIINFPAFNPNDEEVSKLIKILEYVEKSFNEKNTTPIKVNVFDYNDICPRSTFCGVDFPD